MFNFQIFECQHIGPDKILLRNINDNDDKLSFTPESDRPAGSSSSYTLQSPQLGSAFDSRDKQEQPSRVQPRPQVSLIRKKKPTPSFYNFLKKNPEISIKGKKSDQILIEYKNKLVVLSQSEMSEFQNIFLGRIFRKNYLDKHKYKIKKLMNFLNASQIKLCNSKLLKYYQ